MVVLRRPILPLLLAATTVLGGCAYNADLGRDQLLIVKDENLAADGEKAWAWFAELAKLQPRFERSGGPMTEKVTAGEYTTGWFVSAITFWPRLADPARARILGWSFIADGQPMVLRGVAIPKGSKNVNAAKLMLDFIISEEGQRAFGRGGLTPARPGIKPGDGIRHTYSSIAEIVGEQNMIYVGYDADALKDYDAFLARWKQTFNIR